MPKLEEIEAKLDDFLLLEDRGVFRLLLAFMIARRLPQPPSFLFLVGASSGAKTVLLQLFAKVVGYTAMSDLTANTFLSGAKRHDKETSFLNTLTPVSFLVFKDFTTILSKYKEEMAVLMGQLREIYDGAYNRRTGLGDNLVWQGKVSLIAAVTSEMYLRAGQLSSLGERMSFYHMIQPDNLKLGKWMMLPEHRKRDDTKLEAELQTMIFEFERSIEVPTNTADLPDFDEQTEQDLIEISYLATGGRSAVARDQYSRDKRMSIVHDREQIGRFLKQLRVLAYGLALLNSDKRLLPQDKAILYRIGLDSIPLQRKWVLDALTANRLGGTLAQLSDYLKYPQDSVKIWLEDLVALNLVRNHSVYIKGRMERTYSMEPDYARIISKFENIKPENKSLPDSEEQRAQASAEEPPPPFGGKEIVIE